MKKTKMQVSIILLSAITAACGTTSAPDSAKNEKPADIYDQLKNNNVQFATEAKEAESGSPEYIMQNLAEARQAYFRKEYNDVQKNCKRVLSVSPSSAEAYYWLARVAVDQGDYQQAYDMSSKGVISAKEPGMKRELENIKKMTQMGAR